VPLGRCTAMSLIGAKIVALPTAKFADRGARMGHVHALPQFLFYHISMALPACCSARARRYPLLA